MYKTLMDSIWDSLRLFQNNLLPLTAIVLPFVILLEIFDAYYLANYSGGTALLVEDSAPLIGVHLLIQPFYSIAVVFYLSSIISKQTLSVTQSWLLSLKYWPRFLQLSILLNLFVFTGLLFFIIPGIILFIRFAFAEFYLILEQKSPLDAIKSSLIDTKDYFLILLTGFIILAIFTYGPFLVIKQSLGVDEHEISILNIFISIIFDVLTLIFTIFSFRIYHLSKEKSD